MKPPTEWTATGGDNTVHGLGNDTLTGGVGKDVFVFNLAPNTKTNMDAITDFDVVNDLIHLENGIFTSLKPTGVLAKGLFAMNDKGIAVDKDDFVIYNTKTGGLFYDADGNGKGLAVQIAQLQAGLKLTAADFVVI